MNLYCISSFRPHCVNSTKNVELQDNEYQPTESPILGEQAYHDISGSGSLLEEVNMSMVERYFI